MNIDYETLKELLNKFNNSKIKDTYNKEDKNLFEVAGYPHYENVVSNILSFYFDTEEEHGLKDYWIKSLLNCYKSKNKYSEVIGEKISTSNVLREYSNGSDKRIDLLIDCNSFIVLIENKIYASLYNDLDIYTEMVSNYLKDNDNIGVPILKIVLSLYEVSDIKSDEVINITYEELFKELAKNKTKYQINNKWSLLSEEFIENIKRRKSYMKVNKKWIEFAENNIDQVSDFIDIYNKDCYERLDLCKDLCKSIKSIDDSLRCGTYSGGKVDPYYSVYLDIILKDGTDICIETYVMKKPSSKPYEEYSKVYMALWARTRKNKEYLYNIVSKIGLIEAKFHETGGWKEQYILQEIPLELVNINKLASDTVEYAHIIQKEF